MTWATDVDLFNRGASLLLRSCTVKIDVLPEPPWMTEQHCLTRVTLPALTRPLLCLERTVTPQGFVLVCGGTTCRSFPSKQEVEPAQIQRRDSVLWTVVLGLRADHTEAVLNRHNLVPRSSKPISCIQERTV